MTLDVVLAETAWRDLDEIYDWIAERAGPDVAFDYTRRILRLCGTLSDFPARGTPRGDLASDVRTIAFEGRATIAYRVGGDIVLIVRILHKGRDSRRAFET